MGFDAYFINRIDYRLKDQIKAAQDMEFVWHGSLSLGDDVSMWTHMCVALVFFQFDSFFCDQILIVPPLPRMDEHYCTPDGFNWEHGVTQDLPNGDGPPPIVIEPPTWITQSNALERAQIFVTEAKRRARVFKTNNILIPFGCDFTFQNANMMFKNMDRLIDTINEYSGELGATARYSSLSDYAAFVKSTNTTFIRRQEDFFPYADNGASYWTGYFTSRPLLKSVSRAAHGVLRNGDFLFSLVKAQFGTTSQQAWENLNRLRAPEAVVQHHDGVSGTFRRLVGEDYLSLLGRGMEMGNAVISEMLGQFVADDSFLPGLVPDVQYLASQLAQGNTVPTVVFNSLPWPRRFFMNITIDTTAVVVRDFAGNAVNYQVNQRFDGSGLYTLFFLVDLPPLGYRTYLISPGVNTKFVGRVVSLKDQQFQAVQNEHLSLEFNTTTGLLTSYLNKRTQTTTTVSQTFYQYRSYNLPQSSGAYIFRPTGAATIVTATPSLTILAGPYVQQVHQVFRADVISQETFVFSGLSALDGGFAEVHSTIGPLSFDQEIVTLFQTSLQSGTSLLSDNNGFELQARTNLPGGRPGDADAGARIAGNYYPAVSRAAIQDATMDQQFTVATQTTHGVASLASGELEIMLHRMCSRDDSRGMSEALDDRSRYTAIFRFAVETVAESTRFHQRSSKQLSFPPSVSFGNPLTLSQWVNPSHQFLTAALPENMFLLSFNARTGDASQVALRLFNSFEVGSHPTLAVPTNVNILGLFNGLVIADAEERTLTLLDVLATQPADLRSVTINPIEIRTFVAHVAKK